MRPREYRKAAASENQCCGWGTSRVANHCATVVGGTTTLARVALGNITATEEYRLGTCKIGRPDSNVGPVL